jgi:transcriptional regulator GlxA family with amidase domain
MLEFTNRSIDLIASSIGYEDPASFRKVFLRVVGMSPSAYRRRFAATGSGAPPANHGTAAV